MVSGLRSRLVDAAQGAGGAAPGVGDRGVTTERDEATERVRLSEERLCAVVGAATDAAYQMNADWSEMRYLWGRGFLADTVKPSRRWLQDYVPPEAQPAVRAAVERAIASGTRFELEHPIVRIDGSIGWVNSRAVPVSGPCGTIVEWIGMAADVTARREGEAERDRLLARMRAERDRMAALLASMRPEDWFADGDAGFVPANLAFAEAALPFGAAGDVDSRSESREALRPDGEAPLRDSAGAVAGLARDVSKAMEAEAALRDSQERFRAHFANASIGFAVSEPGGRFIDANAALCAITGRTLEELRGLSFAQLVHPEDRAKNLALGERLLAGEIPAFEVENRFVRTDGSSIWVRKNVSLARTSDGEPRWFLVLVEDVTSRVAAEAALREADRRKDDFLAMLAHELRNPLAPISNGLRVLEATGVDPAAAARVREMMARQVAHLERLVDDLLDVSRITRGIIELRRERTDLAAIVNDAVSAGRPRIEALDHVLTVALPVEPLPLDADPARLTQALTNLLDNAAKFTEPGGRIDVAARRDGAEVVVSVRDTGVGIPDGEHESVFGLFAQAGAGVRHERAGLGVGLALARSLVEMHGGRITALSPGDGLGSEFVLRLPLAEREDAAPEAQAARQERPRATVGRVLVVDDNQDVADSFVLLLESMDVDVRVAYDGPSALDIAAAFEPEIVFLDLSMPTMDGFETARRLRSLPAGRDCRLIAVTGWAQAEHRSRTKAAGFDEHLAKPADFHDLMGILSGQR